MVSSLNKEVPLVIWAGKSTVLFLRYSLRCFCNSFSKCKNYEDSIPETKLDSLSVGVFVRRPRFQLTCYTLTLLCGFSCMQLLFFISRLCGDYWKNCKHSFQQLSSNKLDQFLGFFWTLSNLTWFCLPIIVVVIWSHKAGGTYPQGRTENSLASWKFHGQVKYGIGYFNVAVKVEIIALGKELSVLCCLCLGG